MQSYIESKRFDTRRQNKSKFLKNDWPVCQDRKSQINHK